MDVLDAVKLKTRPHHLRAEGLLDILSPRFDLARYRSLLVAFLDFYARAERQLTDGLSVPAHAALNLSSRLKVSALKNDLAALGMPVEGDAAKLEPLLETADRDADFLGLMYVLEGATLGGQVICRHLGETVLANGPEALTFYRGYGAQTGVRWQEFKTYVRDHVTSADDQARFCAAAEATFDAFNRQLERVGGGRVAEASASAHP